jgi:hypothetical protein
MDQEEAIEAETTAMASAASSILVPALARGIASAADERKKSTSPRVC